MSTDSNAQRQASTSMVGMEKPSVKVSLIAHLTRSFHHRVEPPSKTLKVSPHESLVYDTSLLNRDLQGRHMQMIAIGDAIGTGLSALATGWPATLMIGFRLIGTILFVHALGELAVMFPIAGTSI